ncbi:tRNA (guanosine(46)-N7)-methyltransferase TrmB [Heliobacterium gestii]|uniref:tRNA (guanine-N(7)-)-methyltransferase n=1 Tax=Heliomicrobium gestii TaxID=2699 RepID=A0A845LD93_HELGE|nr:tRNA (guanosine(46)-N7)-methyltransferase TrmB [Heliomicrobium gestii]MBM7867844.1 tRNA (guanine-N7-)-methyltransferase [Heliomicrobium gestii]MZP43344.1 tRNA (guanosine(46)-N7)-methyltransferase TrmB [Heliomicrobium gestii]
MRLRRIPGTREKILEYTPWLVTEPTAWQGRWQSYIAGRLGCESPSPVEIHLELGTGRGRFINEMARECPDRFWIGAELREEVLLDALELAKTWEAPNLAFLWINVEQTVDIFGDGEVDGLYLNFSDPWPKERHAKRRLTHQRFLDRYRRYLKTGGLIRFKTDNEELFRFSLEEMAAKGFALEQVTFDLHKDPALASMELSARVMTEYECRFSRQGMPIYRCEARLLPEPVRVMPGSDE